MSDTQLTFAQEIEELAEKNGGNIEAIVVGPFGRSYLWEEVWEDVDPDFETEARLPKGLCNTPLDWLIARPFLDYVADHGYGAPGCHPIYAWTKTHVIFVSQYDGATGLEAIPRNPTPGRPVMPGG